MLVDINLLPQEEKKSKFVYLLLLVGIVFIVTISAIFFFIMQDKKQSLNAAEQQINQINSLLEIERAKLTNFQDSDVVNELQIAIDWSENQPYDVNFLLQELIKRLPQRGFITELSLSAENIVKLRVQFDTKSEASFYLNALTSIEWTEDAFLTEGKTEEIIVAGSEEEQSAEEEVMPRYIASYELEFNDTALKNATEETKDVEGGSSP